MIRQLPLDQPALISALRERTGERHYARWASAAREAGVSEQRIAAHIASEIDEAAAVLDGRCPRCGEHVVAYIDLARQGGPSDVAGVWILLRCSTQPPPGRPRSEGACRFLVDYRIPVTA